MKKYTHQFILLFFSVLPFVLYAGDHSGIPFSPISYSPAMWFDAADINGNGTSPANNTAINQWKDKSGNNYHATAPSTTQRPVYSNGGLQFDGAGDYLSSVDLDTGPNDEMTVVALFTMETTNWPDGNTDGQGWVVSKNAYYSTPYGILVQPNNRVGSVRAGDYLWHFGEPGQKTIFSQTVSGTEVLNLMNSYILRRNTGTLSNDSPFGIGSGNSAGFRSFKGTIYEILVFQKALSRCELSSLEGYLAHKWNATDRLPQDHNFKNQPFGICDYQTFTIPENSNNGTVVGTVGCIEFDNSNAAVTYEIKGNEAAANAFQINSTSGQITVKDRTFLDYEQYGAFSVVVTAKRNGVESFPTPVMVKLTDVNEPGSPPVHSLLWGVNGELWDPRGRLPDFSYAGYHSGELALPNPAPTINVANLGVIPNDGQDDQPLIQQIIDNNSNAVLFFPAGVYELHRAVTINKSNIVLKGGSEGANGTVFYVPYSATVFEGGYKSNFSYGHEGNIFTFQGATSSTNYPIIEPCKRGDKTLTVQNAQQYFSPGELIGIRWTDDNLYGSFWDHLHNNQADDWSTDTPCSWGGADDTKYFTIERVEKHLITLKESLPLDIQLNWTPKIYKTNHIEEVGIRDIRIEFNSPTAAQHLSEPGFNGIGFFHVKNGWINNVTIVNSDNGVQIGKGSVYCTTKDITITGREGHHPVYISDSDYNLLEGMVLNVTTSNQHWWHGISFDHGGHGNVASRSSGNTVIKMDFHKDGPFENLITNTLSEWNHNSSGAFCAGPNAAARNTWWNNHGISYEPHDGYGKEFGQIQSTVIGDLGMNVLYTKDREWYEHKPNITPSNLYEGQLNHRLTKTPIWVFSSQPLEGDRRNYLERDPSRWKVKPDQNGNQTYQLTTTDIPSLTDFKLGEYAILNAAGAECIEADIQSLEDMNTNPSGDVALVLNYIDDQNYDYALITNEPNNNGIHRLQNGIKQMVAVANVTVVLDNAQHKMAFRYTNGTYEQIFDGQVICSYPVGIINNLGKPGLGTINDQSSFDNVLLQCNSDVELDIHLWLEGAYDQATGKLSTRLLQMGLLPSLHPYSGPPWNYPGTEGQGWGINDYPANAVDWVKVSFRTGITKNTEVAATAAVLLEDGALFFPNSRVLNAGMGNSFYVVVEHRNHIGAMSSIAIAINNNKLTYDFRTANSYVLGIGQKELIPGVWALFGGDGDQLNQPIGFDINGQDNTLWTPNNGLFNLYLEWDYNLDGDVNAGDKILWNGNNGIFSTLER